MDINEKVRLVQKKEVELLENLSSLITNYEKENIISIIYNLDNSYILFFL